MMTSTACSTIHFKNVERKFYGFVSMIRSGIVRHLLVTVERECLSHLVRQEVIAQKTFANGDGLLGLF